MNSLSLAEKQSQSLSSLVKDLLNVSMISSGRLTLNKEKVNLSEIITTIPQKYEELIKLSGCGVTTIVKDHELLALCDPVRIEQAVSNLLTNALKYAEGKKVTLSINKKDGFAEISVKDEGEGISEDFQKEIFKPFQRANSKSSTKGLGVGLFIAKQIAAAHKGTISVESKKGKGATFTLTIPLLKKS